jgi:glycosyltransferase involved in cell wall biosynthesis
MQGLLIGLATVLPEDARTRFVLYTRPGAELPDSVAQRRQHFRVLEMPWGPAYIRYGVTLPRLLSRLPVDLLYSITHAPLFGRTPVALQAHDLSFRHRPEFYPWRTRLRLNALVPLHARRARLVITGSELSRRDLIDSYRLPVDKVVVVPDAVQPPRDLPPMTADAEQAWLASLGLRRPFVLYVGNLHRRKNVARLIEAFGLGLRDGGALANHQLAIVGGHWWQGGTEARAAQQLPPGRVVLTGRLPDADRDRLLRTADVLAYPSLFEGFGLPPLEAMAVGTPVLASNTSTMPEILGDAALLVDPLDVHALSRGLERLCRDASLRTLLRERGFKQVKRYDVRETGARALAAFGSALGTSLSGAEPRAASWRSICATETQSLSTPSSSPMSPNRAHALFSRRTTTDISEPWSREYATSDHRHHKPTA